ncbi:MAG: Lipopolysaccharide kinase (Kdo/WaaP) family [Candidatus Sumerlaeota bacterium]|nr:Lipopolysaccharide kinase (Kdo/WaaP) family [Candidatus Sumerlaeota bacterium]
MLPEPLLWNRGPLHGLSLPGYEDLNPAALPWREAASKEPLPTGVLLAKRSRSRLVLAANFHGERLYFKRARARTFRHRLSAHLRGDKLQREWHAAREFLAAGVIVPVPVLYATAGHHETYLVTRGLPSAWQPLSHWFRENGLDQEQLDALADYTRWLHALPAYHDDYRTDHVYRTDAPPTAPIGERYALIDLDGSTTGRIPTRRQREEALLELFVALLRRPFTIAHATRFIERYANTQHRLKPDALYAQATELFRTAKPE